MTLKYVGKDITRPDAVMKATGKALFVADIKLPGMLYAAILRPEYAHARILSIDTSEAEKCEGVIKAVTGKGCKEKYQYGDNIRDYIPMADDKVRHMGEPLAAVIAKTEYQAKQALKKIKVQYEPLPVYIDARDSLKKDAVLIHEESGNYWHLPGMGPKANTNIANHYRLIKGDVEKGFAEADVILEEEFNYPFGSCAAIEPHGAIAWFHEDGMIEIWSSSICPFIIREEVARVYGKPESDVRVHIPELGGCFGYKSDITVEQTVAYIASFAPGHPVRWIATRKEDFLSTLLGHGIRTSIKLGAKKDGTITAIKTKILHSTGAYSDTGIHVSIAAGHNSPGAYSIPNRFLESYLVYTNTAPIGAYRGYGHQETQFAMERAMDILARKLGMDPFKLREKNYLEPGKEAPLGEIINEYNGDLRKCSDTIKNLIFSKPKEKKEDEEYYYGRGFAAIMKTPKGAPFSAKGVYVKFNADGSVVINCGGAEVGQGLRNVVRLVAAETLKLDPSRIHVYTEIDTQFSPWEWQTIGSMFTKQGGRAVRLACLRAIEILKQTATHALRCDIELLDYDGEYVFLSSDPTIKIEVTKLIRGYMHENGIVVGEVAQATYAARLPRYSGLDPETGLGSAGVSYTFGSQAAEIRIEKKTGKIFIDHFASCFDVGRVINPIQIRGQITGGAMMAIGATLCEEIKYDTNGKCSNALFSKYRFPNIKDMPKKWTVICHETPGVIGPFGARGIGEHPTIGPAPSILNAIYDAIGVDLFEIPITPEKMKKILEERSNAQGGR